MDLRTSNSAIWEDLTILVADDNYTCFEIVNEILIETKVNLIYAENGLKALRICQERTVNLIIIDLSMPFMDDLQATKEIKKILPHVPIIAVSACAMETDMIPSKQSGFDDFLPKPFNVNVLFNKIACLLHLVKLAGIR